MNKVRKILVLVLLFAILGFFLPFNDFSCGDVVAKTHVMKINGFDYLVGKVLTYGTENYRIPIEAQMCSILIFLCILLGILVNGFRLNFGRIAFSKLSSVLTTTGTLLMLFFWVAFPMYLRNKVIDLSNGSPTGLIQFNYLSGWYIVFVFLCLSTVLSYYNTHGKVSLPPNSTKNNKTNNGNNSFNKNPILKNQKKSYSMNIPSSKNYSPSNTSYSPTSGNSQPHSFPNTVNQNSYHQNHSNQVLKNHSVIKKTSSEQKTINPAIVWTTSNGIISEYHSVGLLIKACNKFNCNWEKIGTPTKKQVQNGSHIVYQKIKFMNNRNQSISISVSITKEIVETYYRYLYKLVLTGGK